MNPKYVLLIGTDERAGRLSAILQKAGIPNKVASKIQHAVHLVRANPPAGVVFAEAIVENEPFWELFSQIRHYAPSLVTIVVKGEDIAFHETAQKLVSYGEVKGEMLIVYRTTYTADNPLLGQNGLDGSPTMYINGNSLYLEKELTAFVRASMLGN